MVGQAAKLTEALTAGYRFARQHTFDPQQVSSFALSVGDANPIHHDAELASGTHFGGLIVSATHTTALMMGFVASHFAQRATVLGIHFSVPGGHFKFLHLWTGQIPPPPSDRRG